MISLKEKTSMLPYKLWVLISAWLTCTGWGLSLIKQLNAVGYVVSLILFAGAFTWWVQSCSTSERWIKRGLFVRLRKRFRKPIPLIYMVCLLAAILGGTLYAPTNYDALCYRLPRILHWWSEGGWHWIGGINDRMDFSATGFEWLMAPTLILFKTDRFLFLINVISYALLPGLIYSVLVGLSIRRRVAWYWMWILPTAYCFALQAGSIGNDMFATVYFLASAAFALRAVRNSSWPDAAFSLLAAGLMTGAKATNLPLLLPLVILMIPLKGILLRRPVSLAGILLICIFSSFIQTAISNSFYSGTWGGDKDNLHRVQISNPIAGVIGNSLQVTIGALAPPIFPAAKLFNKKSEELLTHPPLSDIKKNFPRLELILGEMVMEEGAGLGLGITILLIISLMAGFFIKGRWYIISSKNAFIFGLLTWVALAAFMAKLGSESAARLAAPYYAGIVIPLLALRSQGLLVAKIWWRLLAMACALSVVPALLLNPARPLIPVKTILATAKACGLNGSAIQRVEKVYGAYGNRNDQLKEVRLHLPLGSKVIGFSGTADESEYSFWKPLEGRKVTDLNPTDGKMPDLDGVDVIVGSEWGINDRYRMKADELAARVYGKILWRKKIAIMAGREPQEWNVITPIDGQAFRVTK
jgi:hypothetical protein